MLRDAHRLARSSADSAEPPAANADPQPGRDTGERAAADDDVRADGEVLARARPAEEAVAGRRWRRRRRRRRDARLRVDHEGQHQRRRVHQLRAVAAGQPALTGALARLRHQRQQPAVARSTLDRHVRGQPLRAAAAPGRRRDGSPLSARRSRDTRRARSTRSSSEDRRVASRSPSPRAAAVAAPWRPAHRPHRRRASQATPGAGRSRGGAYRNLVTFRPAPEPGRAPGPRRRPTAIRSSRTRTAGNSVPSRTPDRRSRIRRLEPISPAHTRRSGTAP